MKKFLSVILVILILISTFSFAISVSAATNVKVTVKSSQDLFSAISNTYKTGDVFELRIRWKSDQLLRDGDFSTLFDNTGLKVVSEEVNTRLANAVTNISDDIQKNHSMVTANFSSYDGVDFFSTEYLVKYQIKVLNTASSSEVINVDFAEATGIPATGNLAEEVVYIFNHETLSANKNKFTLSAKFFDVDSSVDNTTAPTSVTTAPPTVTTAPTTASVPSQTNKYFFLTGSFNDWATLIMSLSVSGDTATATVLVGKGTFNFYIIENSTKYGYNGEIVDSTTDTGVTMRSGAESATLIATGGLYYFKYNTNTRKLVVTRYTENTTVPTETTAPTVPTTEPTETTAPIPTTEPTEQPASNYYLTGSFNDWSMTDTPFVVSDETSATAKVVLEEGSYEFKIVDKGTLYGYSGGVISNKTSTSGITMKSSGGYATLQVSGGTYIFNYNPFTKKLVITHSSGSEGEYKPNQTDPTEKPSDTDISVTTPTDQGKNCQSGHTYDAGMVTKKATYFAKGKKVQTCSVCGTTKTVKIAVLKLSKPNVVIKGGKKQFSVKYNKVANATGFQIKYKVKGSSVTKLFAAKKNVTKKIKNLKKGKYKVQVRAYVKKNSKRAYSKWTAAKNVTVK